MDDPVSYEIVGTERDVFYFGNQLEDRLSSLRQWYSPVATLGFPIVMVLLFVLFGWFVVGLVAVSDDFGLKGEVDTLREGLLMPVVMIVILAIFFGFLWLMTELRGRLFPVGIVAIGDGVARYKRLQNIHKVTGSIIFITIGLGLLVGYLTDVLFKTP